MKRTIVIGADHHGFEYKEYIKTLSMFDGIDVMWIDVGTDSTQRTDYPIFAQRVCQVMQEDPQVGHGILICASGVGMAVAANRYKKIYAAVVWNSQTAQLSVEHDHANIIIIPSMFVQKDMLVPIISAWLHAKYFGGRYQKRIDMIDKIT